jgi:hypothetical protein
VRRLVREGFLGLEWRRGAVRKASWGWRGEGRDGGSLLFWGGTAREWSKSRRSSLERGETLRREEDAEEGESIRICCARGCCWKVVERMLVWEFPALSSSL